jgi:putative heme-binding domain-containing protein
VVAVGTTNPWGLDFDEYGQCFITNCVIAHLWHVIPGAHYERMYGQHFNPYHYGSMKTCADHLHWESGTNWTDVRKGVSAGTSEAGGGHAHIGAMIYQGDNWPAEYRGGLFTCNLHGNRVNRDVFEQKGSGYVAHHGKDFLFANDPWFRGLAIKQGPDGAVYISDWTDTGECHNYEKADKSNGRIYRVVYGDRGTSGPHLSALTDGQLIAMAAEPNAWTSRTVRRVLHERAAAGKLEAGTPDALRAFAPQWISAGPTLGHLWQLWAVGGLDEPTLTKLLGHAEPYVRGWAVRLAVDAGVRPSDAVLATFARMAKADASPVVRLHLASALQRLPVADRWPIAEALVRTAEDAETEPAADGLVRRRTARAADRRGRWRWPSGRSCRSVSQYIARRAADGGTRTASRPSPPCSAGPTTKSSQVAAGGLKEALAGLRNTDMPEGWPAVYQKLYWRANKARSATPRRPSGWCSATSWRWPTCEAGARSRPATPAAEPGRSQSLVNARDPELADLLHKLLNDRDVRQTAIRGLAVAGHPESAKRLLAVYPKLTAFEHPDAIQTLVSRPAYAGRPARRVEAGTVAKDSLGAHVVRQIAGMSDAGVKEKLKKVWGDVRPPEKDKAQKIAKLKKEFTADDLKRADLAKGRATYDKTCAACHTLFDAGGKVGPNLTGSQRSSLDYVLENVIDPSGQVAKEYRVTIVDTKDGRTVEGIVAGETDNHLTLRTTTEDVSLPKAEIEKRRLSPAEHDARGDL